MILRTWPGPIQAIWSESKWRTIGHVALDISFIYSLPSTTVIAMQCKLHVAVRIFWNLYDTIIQLYSPFILFTSLSLSLPLSRFSSSLLSSISIFLFSAVNWPFPCFIRIFVSNYTTSSTSANPISHRSRVLLIIWPFVSEIQTRAFCPPT